ncbi:MAG: cadherin-like beta sandwich domain-containing protein [Anaeroplasmataceae bacterium]|nr:cadherin-like beta sandwich domain-containing protein [Anaeroplasmataceae bacterium]
MKKIITKLGFIFTGLLLVLSVGIFFLADNTVPKHNESEGNQGTTIAVTNGAENFTHSDFSTSVEVVYSDEIWSNDSRLDSITDATNGYFYVSVYMNVSSGVKAFTFSWRLDSSVNVQSIEFVSADGDEMDAYIYDHEDDLPISYRDFTRNGKVDNGAQYVTYNEGNNSFSYTSSNLLSLNMATGTNPEIPAGKWLLGKLKVTTNSSTSSFSMSNVTLNIQGTDTGGRQLALNSVSGWNMSFGAGAPSGSTLTTATIGSVSKAGTESGSTGTISIELEPTAFSVNTSYTLSLSVDGGKGSASSLSASSSGMGVSGSSFTVNFSSRNTTLTGSFVATAQDGTTTKNYTISVKIKPYTDAALTSLSISQATSGVSFSPIFIAANSANANVNSTSDKIKITSTTTQINVTPTVDTSKGMTVTVNGTAITSGASTRVNVSNNAQIVIVVKPEDPTAATKTYTYTCEQVTDIETVTSVALSSNGTTLLTRTESQLGTGNTWTFTIPYSTNGTPNNTVLINITPKTGSTASVSPQTLTFSNTTTTQTETATVTITDSTTGKVTTKTISVTRQAADSNKNVATNNGIVVTYTKNGNINITGALSGTTMNCTTKLPYDISTVNLTVNLAKSTSRWSYTVAGGAGGESSNNNLASGAQQSVILESPNDHTAKQFTISIVVTAEDQTTQTYTVNIQREGPDDDSKLSTFNVPAMPTGGSLVFHPSNLPISVSNLPTTTTTLTISATAAKNTSIVKVLDSGGNLLFGGTGQSTSGSLNLSGLSTTTSLTYTVRVESQAYAAGDTTKYTDYILTISAKPEDPKSSDSSVDSITVTPAGGGTEANLNVNQNPPVYAISYDGTTTGTTITVVPHDSKAIVTIQATLPDGSVLNSVIGQKLLNINNLPSGSTTVNITVLAEDQNQANAKSYVINISKVAKDTENGITSITVNSNPVTVPAPGASTSTTVGGTPIPSSVTMNVIPKSNKATVNVVGATKNPDGTWNVPVSAGLNNVAITVTPEDSNAQVAIYTVGIWVNDSTLLSDLKVEISGTPQTMTPSFNPTTPSYEVTVPYSTTSVDLTYTLAATNPSNVNVQINGSTANPISGNSYTQNVSTPGSETTITVKVLQSASPLGPQHSSTEYTVKIKKASANTDNYIESVDIPNNPISFNKIINEYIIVLPRTQQALQFSNLTYSDDATVTTSGIASGGDQPSIINFGLHAGVNRHTISVKSEGAAGLTNTYVFWIVCAENLGDLTNINLLAATGVALQDVDGNTFTFNQATTNPPKFTVNGDVSSLQIRMQKEGTYATAMVGSTEYSNAQRNETHQVLSLAEGDNTYVIKAISELQYVLDHSVIPENLKQMVTANASQEYTIIVERKAKDNDATLKQFEVRIGNVNKIVGFVPGSHSATYTIGNIGDASSISIVAVPTKSTTTVGRAGGSSDVTPSDSTNQNQVVGLITQGAGAYSFVITITTTAEDGTTHETYTVELARGDIDPNKDTTITNIYIQDDKGQKNYMTFDPTTDTYNVTIPAGVTNYTLFTETLPGSKAKVSINGVTEFNHFEGPIDDTYWNASQPSKVYTIMGVAANNTTGNPYIVNVSFEKPSNIVTLDKLIVNSENLDVTQGPNYTLSVPYETTNIPLFVQTTDASAKITVNHQDGSAPTTLVHELDLSNYVLNEGPNTITVLVTAQDGSTYAYQITVNRAYKDPRLSTLGVLGYPLLENDPTKEIEVEFDPEKKEYRVNVPFIKEQAEIFATPENENDIVTGIGVKNLLVGENEFIVRVSNPTGSSMAEYKVIIRRYSSDDANADAATAKILEIPQFELDFDPLNTLYEYHVTNDITELTPIFTPARSSGKSSVEYYGTKLHSGENALVVIITAPDGITTKTYVVKVNRDKMAYEVKNDIYPDYSLALKEGEENVYNVNIGSAKSVDVDFAKFIFPETENLEVNVISDVLENPDEVIVTIFDGEETEIVKFIVESTGNPKDGIQWKDLWPLLLLIIILLIILILILICVNKDKFGRVAKKANNKNEKKNKKEEKKNSK